MIEPSSASLAAQAWAEVQASLDLQLSPLGLAAIEALSLKRGDIVLDVGCGAGQTVVQISELVGIEGRVIGVDIAPLLLNIGKRRAEHLPQASFLEADAQTLDLSPQSLDVVFSRFGVMALSDPEIAFRNFRRMMKPDGRIGFVCWRALEENELDDLPLKSAGLEGMADRTPFSLADDLQIQALLKAAGFQRIEINAKTEIVSSGDLEHTLEVLLKVGALGRVLREHPGLRADAAPRVRSALAERMATQAGLNAATWVVTARAGS